ncbi:MAG: hypothetical protein K2G88_04285 [Oscillospiraceae bacterium]|nr:hypothetical protein [Oscillospiraceae bacterium]
MTTFSIISIILFSLSGVLFIVAVVVFFTTDVWVSIKYLSSKDKTGGNSEVDAPGITIDRKPAAVIPASNSPVSSPALVGGIEYAQQTIDTDEMGEDSSLSFETQDWDLPEGVSFVLTKNILVCHSDKEYTIHEN